MSLIAKYNISEKDLYQLGVIESKKKSSSFFQKEKPKAKSLGILKPYNVKFIDLGNLLNEINSNNYHSNQQLIEKYGTIELDNIKSNIGLKYITPAVVFIIAFFVIANLIDKTKYSNGEGFITHESGKDWNTEDTWKKLGEKVWKFSHNHQDARKLTLVIVDECQNSKGEKSEYKSEIIFDSIQIADYRTYKDVTSFNKNCYGFGAMLLKWRPCGNSPLR
jgi:hypothetical protein